MPGFLDRLNYTHYKIPSYVPLYDAVLRGDVFARMPLKVVSGMFTYLSHCKPSVAPAQWLKMHVVLTSCLEVIMAALPR